MQFKAGGSSLHGPTNIWGNRYGGGCGQGSGNETADFHGKVAVWAIVNDCDHTVYEIEDSPGASSPNGFPDYYLEFTRNADNSVTVCVYFANITGTGIWIRGVDGTGGILTGTAGGAPALFGGQQVSKTNKGPFCQTFASGICP